MNYPIIVQFAPWSGGLLSEKVKVMLPLLGINLQFNDDMGLYALINSYPQLGQLIVCILSEYEVMTIQREDNILLYYGAKGRKMTQR